MVDREHPLSVVRQARLLEISHGAVYYHTRPTRESNLALMRRIDELYLEHP
jgi:putative transposase